MSNTTLKPRTTEVVIYQGDDLMTISDLRRRVSIAERRRDDRRAALEGARAAAGAAAEQAARNQERYGDEEDPDEAEVTADDVAELADLEAEVVAAREAYDAGVDEASERAVVVELRAVGSKPFRALVEAHPPRKVPGHALMKDAGDGTHPDDAPFGVDTTTFPRALLTYVHDDYADVRTVAAPMFPVGALGRFLDLEVSDGDFETMWQSAFYLNRSAAADPKATRYSTGSPSGRSS